MKEGLSAARSNRNITADYLRGIAAVLVITGHLLIRDEQMLAGENHFLWLLYSVHMSLFFAISGYFFPSAAEQPFGKLFCQKAARLLLPYVAWSTVAVAAKAALAVISGRGLSAEIFLQWAKTLLFATSMWFFLALFAVYLLFWLVVRIFKRNPYGAVTLLLIAYLLPLPDVLALHDAQAMLPFFGLGLLLAQYQSGDWKIPKQPWNWLIPAVAVLLLLAAPLYVPTAFRWRRDYGLQLMGATALSLVATAAFSVVMLMIGKWITPLRRFFGMFGRYSMELYCIHMLFVSYLQIPVGEYLWKLPMAVVNIVYLIFGILIGLICVVISRFALNKIGIYRWIMLGQLPIFKRRVLKSDEQLEK